MKISSSDIKDFFKSKLDIELGSGGRIVWDTSTNKKNVVDGNRPYNAESKPGDNIYKFNVGPTPYIIFDADGIDLEELHKQYPTLENTLYTTTTAVNKRHYYILPPVNNSKDELAGRKVNREAKFDIFTNGPIFEGHGIDHSTSVNVVPGEPFSINNEEVVRFSVEEWDTLLSYMSSLDAKTTHSLLGIRMPRQHEADILKEWLKIDSAYFKTNVENNNLIRALWTSEYLDDIPPRSKKLEHPGELEYDLLNKAAYKMTMNACLSSTTRDEILEKIVTDVYGYRLDSPTTEQKLYKSIIGTLPYHDELAIEVDKQTTLQEELRTIYNKQKNGYLMTRSGKSYAFLEINIDTMRIVMKGRDNEYEMSLAHIKREFGLTQQDASVMQEIKDIIPEVKIVNIPTKPRVYFDFDNNIDVYNISPKSVYQDMAIPSETKPNNVITRVIHSVMGEWEDLYYHWLAHAAFGEPPQTVLSLVTPEAGGSQSGKSVVSAYIPSRLIGSVAAIEVDELKSGWGDVTYGASVICINDMKKVNSKDWNEIYPKIRDESNKGLKRKKNMKHRAYIEVEQATSFTISANYFFPLEEHDRRFFVLRPQHLAGKTEKLNDADSVKIWELLENSALSDFHPELQELTNYCKHLYQTDRWKYRDELFKKAPETDERIQCLAVDKSHSGRIIVALKNGPAEFEKLIDPKEKAAVAKLGMFLLYQYSHNHSNYVSLPWMWLHELLMRVQEDGNNQFKGHTQRKPASVVKSLNLAEGELHTASIINQSYRDENLMHKLGLPKEWASWSVTNHYNLPFTPELEEEWRQWINDNNSLFVESIPKPNLN